MALVDIINVQVLDNPTSFTNPFQFEVTFECIQELSDGTYFSILHSKSCLITRSIFKNLLVCDCIIAIHATTLHHYLSFTFVFMGLYNEWICGVYLSWNE